MELVEENQKTPLAIMMFFMVGLMAVSEVITRVAMGGQIDEVNRFYWFMERSAGFTAYELLTLSAILGVSMTSTIWDRYGLRKWAKQLHQFTTLLILPFLGIHLFGLLQDSKVPFTWMAVLVPLKTNYHPFFTALGILSMYGMLLLIVTSYLRERIGMKVWRIVHFIAFPLFIAVTLHGIFNGTDSRTSWAFWMYAMPLAWFVLFTILRMFKPFVRKGAARSGAQGRGNATGRVVK